VNQAIIGKFIAKKRRELNLTQEQLGEALNVSNKSVSKWETGKCMPDYSIIESLCQTLCISMSELLDGEENEKENIRVYDDRHMLYMIERVQRLEIQNHIIIGIMLVVTGLALMGFSSAIDGVGFQSFVSGLMTGMSIAVMLTGVFVIARSISIRMK